MTPNDSRAVASLIPATRTLEGGGFPVRRPFPTPELPLVDPFLLLDEMGPVRWGPGEAIGAPDHPHRGFETVTYLLVGRMQHRDSAGHAGVLGPGDVQWMTAGSGVVHSEMPEDEFLATGGESHGFQIWVNLPRRDKMMAPRYQEVPRSEIPVGRSGDGRVTARVVAGEALGVRAVIDTVTPIQYVHYTIRPGGRVTQVAPPEHNALAYIFAGEARVGPGEADARRVADGELAILGDGGSMDLAVDAGADRPAEILVLTGVPLREPVARYGPFVMSTQREIIQAVEDYQAGRLGRIAP